jgi:hypothetical protein
MPAPARRMGWLGAGVRRPSGEEAAFSRQRAGDVWRGYGDCVLRRGLIGTLVGRNGGSKRQLEAVRRIAALAVLSTGAPIRSDSRPKAATVAAGLAPWPEDDGGSGSGMSARRGS